MLYFHMKVQNTNSLITVVKTCEHICKGIQGVPRS